jgi:hypothetical protein
MLKFKPVRNARQSLFFPIVGRAIAVATALSLSVSQGLALPAMPPAAVETGASVDLARMHAGGGHRGGMHRPPGGGMHRPPGGGVHRPPGVVRPPVGGVRPPGYRPGYPGYRPGYRPPGLGYHGPVVVGPGFRPANMWWQPGGAIAAGVAIGVISAAAAASWAGQPPGPNYCWYYTDASRRNGFWDLCRR